MGSTLERKIVVVTRRTRIEELINRFHTLEQARFYIEHLGADFKDYEHEHITYQKACLALKESLTTHGRTQWIDRGFLPTFLFGQNDIVFALGQDGLVANIMKYLNGQPLVGINPDPQRYDGILLPFQAKDIQLILPDLINNQRSLKSITMAKAILSDGQTLYGVNDLFVGPKTHTSARYQLTLGQAKEIQSSSGIIISTGLGSTGWMTSVITGSTAISNSVTHNTQPVPNKRIPWNTDYLQFAVREPFPSRSSAATLIFGRINAQTPLQLSSLMPENGVIFSDGIESDFLNFNSGTTAQIGIADRVGQLVV